MIFRAFLVRSTHTQRWCVSWKKFSSTRNLFIHFSSSSIIFFSVVENSYFTEHWASSHRFIIFFLSVNFRLHTYVILHFVRLQDFLLPFTRVSFFLFCTSTHTARISRFSLSLPVQFNLWFIYGRLGSR